MNPQEIQKQNIESSKTPEKKEGKIENLNIPKSTILSKYPNFDIFSKTINTLNNDTKNKLLAILASIPEDELTMYIEMDADSSNLITESDIKRFIAEKYTGQKTLVLGINDNEKIDNSEEILNNDSKENKEAKNNNESQALETLKKNNDRYKEIFGADSEFFKIFQRNENNPEKLATELENFLKTPKNRKAVFDKIAATGDAKLYQETYNSLSNLSPTISGYLSDIPSTIYKVEKPILEKPDNKAIISQFPGAKPEDIEKRGDLVSYRDKTIDLKTGKAFISGEGGYAIETSMKVPNSLDLRVKYQKERLKILETIKNKENTLEQIKEYKNTLAFEKNLHAEYEKISLNQDIDSNLRKTEIESQLKLIVKYKELAEERFPRLKKDPEVFADDMKKVIEEEKGKLKGLKEEFDEDMQKLLTAGQDEIKFRDEKVRKTMIFLDDLGITNINQNDLQKIINRININPQTYGFSKPIDLRKGFEGEVNNVHKQKHELLKLFSKIYQKMGIDISGTDFITDYKKIKAEHQKEKFDINFKELLFIGGTFQIETFFNLIKQEPEKKQNTQEN